MSLRPDQLATVEYIDGSQRVLLDELKQLRDELQNALRVVAPQPLDRYLSIEQIMACTNYSRTKVTEWIEVGKKGPNGQLVKLPTLKFGDQVRVKLADLEAFGRVYQQVGQERAVPATRKTVSNRSSDSSPLRAVA